MHFSTPLGAEYVDLGTFASTGHRVDAKTNRELVGPARREYVRDLTGRPIAPEVLAHDDGEVVGWAAVAPQAELPFERSTKIPHVDDLPVCPCVVHPRPLQRPTWAQLA